ncbi:hypothetical protein DID80_04950 [Candidatus Marinamargulisbacteria bacterium SCGC AAA071-K20]|nr:hypothetical protein DID80_04950 [Candidatus Marinamargulisbacteria bacterium SCGC AAA071-K20]
MGIGFFKRASLESDQKRLKQYNDTLVENLSSYQKDIFDKVCNILSDCISMPKSQILILHKLENIFFKLQKYYKEIEDIDYNPVPFKTLDEFYKNLSERINQTFNVKLVSKDLYHLTDLGSLVSLILYLTSKNT